MMQMRIFQIVPLIGGVFIAVGALFHGLAGWPHLSEELREANVQMPLFDAIHLGWMFGSFAMFAAGAIVIISCIRLLRGAMVNLTPTVIVGALYTGYGGWAYLVSGYHGHFLLFVITGLLVVSVALSRPRHPNVV